MQMIRLFKRNFVLNKLIICILRWHEGLTKNVKREIFAVIIAVHVLRLYGITVLNEAMFHWTIFPDLFDYSPAGSY